MSDWLVLNLNTGRVLIGGELDEVPGSSCREVTMNAMQLAVDCLNDGIAFDRRFLRAHAEISEEERLSRDRAALDFSKDLIAAVEADDWLNGNPIVSSVSPTGTPNEGESP